MGKKHYYAVICIASLLAGCTTGFQPESQADTDALSTKSQDILARFEPTGETQTCLPTRWIRDIKPLSDTLFLVRVGTSKYYLNRPTSSCEEATRTSSALRYQVDGAPNLCTGETVNVISNRSGSSGLLIGGCALGTFEEVQEKTKS